MFWYLGVFKKWSGVTFLNKREAGQVLLLLLEEGGSRPGQERKSGSAALR